jgi:hypothetical protein
VTIPLLGTMASRQAAMLEENLQTVAALFVQSLTTAFFEEEKKNSVEKFMQRVRAN